MWNRSRFVIVDHLSNIAKDNTRMKVAFDIGLLEGHDLRTKHMLNLEAKSVVLLET